MSMERLRAVSASLNRCLTSLREGFVTLSSRVAAQPGSLSLWFGPTGLSAPVAVPSEVGVAGVGAVLESVVQRAVHADVGHPDQGDGEDARLVLPNTYPSECRGQRCGVRQVVEVCTDTRAPEVA